MTNSDDGRRRFGEKEVGLIIKRATELQQEDPDVLSEGDGLSLTELEEVAVEAGIDARFLRQAAKERSLQIMIRSGNGETVIHVEERLHAMAGALFGGIIGGVGGGVVIVVGVGVGVGALGSAPVRHCIPYRDGRHLVHRRTSDLLIDVAPPAKGPHPAR